MLKLLAIVLLVVLGNMVQAQHEVLFFSSSRNGTSAIMQLHVASNTVSVVYDSEHEDWAPVPGPENSLSFLTDTGDSIRRMQIDIASGDVHEVGHPPNCTLNDKNAVPSPDGSMLAYECNGQVYVMGIESNKPVWLTESIQQEASKVCWFPDSRKVAFTLNSDGQYDIAGIDIAERKVIYYCQSEKSEEGPDISPDGKYMVYSSSVDDSQNRDLFVLDMTTREARNITNTPDWELIGRWSYDGSAIYYGSNRDGNWELYKYDLNTEKTSRITFDDAFDGDPRSGFHD